jgi:ketosteroid isomerase-like protein
MEEVLAAAERRARALCERDADALRALHHPDLRWTTHRGVVLDRESYIAGNVEGDLVWRAQHLEDVTVVVEGDTAILVGVVVDEVERHGERAVFRLRLTQTWVRGEAGWVCLAGHASTLPG